MTGTVTWNTSQQASMVLVQNKKKNKQLNSFSQTKVPNQNSASSLLSQNSQKDFYCVVALVGYMLSRILHF